MPLVCFVIDVKASLLLSIIKAPPTPHNKAPPTKNKTQRRMEAQKKSPIKT